MRPGPLSDFWDPCNCKNCRKIRWSYRELRAEVFKQQKETRR